MATINISIAAKPTVLPVVDAGADGSVAIKDITQTTLSGSAVDPDGSILSVLWTFISGPSTPSIVSPTSMSTLVTGLSSRGSYVFRLTAIDNDNNAAFDNITIVALGFATVNVVLSEQMDPSVDVNMQGKDNGANPVDQYGTGTDSWLITEGHSLQYEVYSQFYPLSESPNIHFLFKENGVTLNTTQDYVGHPDSPHGVYSRVVSAGATYDISAVSSGPAANPGYGIINRTGLPLNWEVRTTPGGTLLNSGTVAHGAYIKSNLLTGTGQAITIKAPDNGAYNGQYQPSLDMINMGAPGTNATIYTLNQSDLATLAAQFYNSTVIRKVS